MNGVVMKIEIGNKIKWDSAAGVLTGTVKNIMLNLNAANQTIPWMDVADITDEFGSKYSSNRMCANDGYLKMMKVEVL